jgi:hypothetical protein
VAVKKTARVQMTTKNKAKLPVARPLLAEMSVVPVTVASLATMAIVYPITLVVVAPKPVALTVAAVSAEVAPLDRYALAGVVVLAH